MDTPPLHLIATGWIALAETNHIVKERYQELASCYPSTFMKQLLSLSSKNVASAQEVVKDFTFTYFSIGNTGIFGALWDFAVQMDLGLSVHLDAIKIRQETIEICEFYGLNPYRLPSDGCFLIATDQVEYTIQILKQYHIPASDIGIFTSGADRLILYDGKIQYLTPPKAEGE